MPPCTRHNRRNTSSNRFIMPPCTPLYAMGILLVKKKRFIDAKLDHVNNSFTIIQINTARKFRHHHIIKQTCMKADYPRWITSAINARNFSWRNHLEEFSCNVVQRVDLCEWIETPVCKNIKLGNGWKLQTGQNLLPIRREYKNSISRAHAKKYYLLSGIKYVFARP